MKCIVGLGNPGKQYEHTRHNAGFAVVDELAKQLDISFRLKQSSEAEIAEGMLGNERILLVKPQTFMNASGRAVSDVLRKYPISIEELIIVYDDADLPFGDIRFKQSGSSAGHRGMESIMDTIGKGNSIARVRFGIGRPSNPDVPLEDFVLTKWTSAEQAALSDHIQKAIEALTTFLSPV